MADSIHIDTLIAVFAKPPIPGQVKTRLIPELGAVGAAKLAAAFIIDVTQMLSRLEWARVVVATTGAMKDERLSRALRDVPLWDQGDGDLGARMERVLARGLAEGARSAIALGADSPGLGPRHLARAREELESHDAVLGPTADGGYYLLGLRQCPRGILEDLPWSTVDTFAATANRLKERGISLGLGEPFFDIDEPRDLQRFVRGLQDGSLSAPASELVLREMQLL